VSTIKKQPTVLAAVIKQLLQSRHSAHNYKCNMKSLKGG